MPRGPKCQPPPCRAHVHGPPVQPRVLTVVPRGVRQRGDELTALKVEMTLAPWQSENRRQTSHGMKRGFAHVWCLPIPLRPRASVWAARASSDQAHRMLRWNRQVHRHERASQNLTTSISSKKRILARHGLDLLDGIPHDLAENYFQNFERAWRRLAHVQKLYRM